MNSDRNKCDYVDSQCPGFRVVAGPFSVGEDSPRWRPERDRCRKVMENLRVGGVERKLVMWRGQAYVLRSEKGWREANTSLALPVGSAGLHCPLCHCGPYKTARSLGMHRCLRVPRVMVKGRELRGKLSEEQIQMAVEAALKV